MKGRGWVGQGGGTGQVGNEIGISGCVPMDMGVSRCRDLLRESKYLLIYQR